MTIQEKLKEAIEKNVCIAFNEVQNIDVAVGDCVDIVKEEMQAFDKWKKINNINEYIRSKKHISYYYDGISYTFDALYNLFQEEQAKQK